MSIISGLSCTQSTGDTTATVANIFQHEKSPTWNWCFSQLGGRTVYLQESNKYSCSHKSQPLKKTKLFQQQGVDGHFLYVPINRQEMLIPRESDIFNTLRMNFAQPKEFQLLWWHTKSRGVMFFKSLIKLTWSVSLLCSKTQPWLNCSRQIPGLLGMTLSHPPRHVYTPPSKFPHLIKVLRFLHWFTASPFIGSAGVECFANISRERKQLNRLSLKLGPSLRWPRVSLNGNTHEIWSW